MRCTLGPHHHAAEIRLVKRHELGEDSLVLGGAQIRKARTAPSGNEEVRVERHRTFTRRPLDETRELRPVSLRDRRLNDEVETVRAKAGDRRLGCLEGTMSATEVVVVLWRERIDADGESRDPGALERLDAPIVEQCSVRADDDRRAVMCGMLGDTLEVRA